MVAKSSSAAAGGGTRGASCWIGSVTVSGDTMSTVTFANLVWNLGDCYPRGGTLTTRKGLITTVVTFDANTPATGLVKVTVGRKSATIALPAYGQCGAKDGGP